MNLKWWPKDWIMKLANASLNRIWVNRNRALDVGEGGRMSLEGNPSCAGEDKENRVDVELEFDGENRVLVDEVELPGVEEASEPPALLEDIKRPVVSGVIDQPLFSEGKEIHGVGDGRTDRRILEIEAESITEEDDAKEDVVVSNEGNCVEPRVGLQLVAEASNPTLEENAEEALAPLVDNKTEMVGGEVICCEMQTDGIDEEPLLNPQLEIKLQEQFISDVNCKEVVSIVDVDSVVPHCGLHQEHDDTTMGEDELEYKVERGMGDTEKIGDVGHEKGVLFHCSTERNDPDAIMGISKACEEDDHAFNLDVGTLKYAPFIYEGLTGCETKEDISNISSYTAEVTEGIPYVFTGSEPVNVHNVSEDMDYVSGSYAEDKMVAENCISRTSMLEDENMDMELTKGSNLAANVNTAEFNVVEVAEEELLPMNSKTEVESGVKLEPTDVVVESKSIQLADAEVETDLGTEVEANGILDEGSKMETEETASVVDDPGQAMFDSSVAPRDEEDEAIAGEEEIGSQDTEMETEADVAESGKTARQKRKRDNISKRKTASKTGEDVCFICCDGGSLVLCDRRGCPKAYHPSCVNRDESFFRPKGRWTCGWHLCNVCEKNAHYMCYTCPYSLCKKCIKGAVIFCVRDNKGFCDTCMRSVTQIEDNEQGIKDAEVDFDDESSWEYLFKDYFTILKDKLSLSFSEIAKAKNPWKGAVTTGNCKKDSSKGQAGVNDGVSCSEDSAAKLERVKPKRRKEMKHAESHTKKEKLPNSSVTAGDRAISLNENSRWASRELLAFVSHMKNGDNSALSPSDVQALLLEYIKRNKLRDPHRKSQIICDARLGNLLGKPQVGCTEMLKLLECHFLLKDEQNDDVQGSVVGTENLQLENGGNTDTIQKAVKDKRKIWKKGGKRQSNLDDYAAIDRHNIGLIYLRRKLMEDLLEDAETFPEKVTGTFVRIRISGGNQKQDLYRLVQVVGTRKAPEPYKSGKRTTDIILEILNLKKTEIVSVATISNQDFTEEECKRLRQNIKCGFINPLTVGLILDKTMELQPIRVNDWLESETLRLTHLRDRASDLGRQKELRECVEKLQLLKTPEQRMQQLEECPKIHVDPTIDPSYEPEENDSETGNGQAEVPMRSMRSSISCRERLFNSPRSDRSSKESSNFSAKISSRNVESGRSMFRNASSSPSVNGKMMCENPQSSGRDPETHQADNLGRVNSVATSESSELVQQAASRSGSVSVGTPSTSRGSLPSGEVNESEKIWHYLDPKGSVQGPFSMFQLRKWSSTGYFPDDLRIWKATEKPENKLLLTDALAGKVPRTLSLIDDIFSATDSLYGSHGLVDNSVQSSGESLNQDKERSNVDHISSSSLSNMSTELSQNGPGALLSPAQGQSSVGWNAQDGAIQLPLTPVVPDSVPVSTSAIPNAASSPSSSSNPALRAHSIPLSEKNAVQMPPQPLQPQGYSWSAAPSIENSSGVQPMVPHVSSPQNSWPQEKSMGIGPESSSGAITPANLNISWMNPPPTGWVAPVGNSGDTNVQDQAPGSNKTAYHCGCAPNQAWYGNGWGMAPPQAPPPHGNNPNQAWVPPSPGGDHNYSGGGQFPGRPRDSFGGSRFKTRDAICPYNANGRCRKGARCDYRHVC